MKIVGIILGGLVSFIFLLLLAVGTATELGYLPPVDVLHGNEVDKKHIATLKKSKIIEENENIYYFYSGGFWSILEDGNLFTDERVISYETYEGQLDVYSSTYNEIEKIEINRSDDFWGLSEITITKKDDSWFILYVDNQNDMDTLFVDELKKVWGE